MVGFFSLVTLLVLMEGLVNYIWREAFFTYCVQHYVCKMILGA